MIHDLQPDTVTGYIRARDVDYLPKVADDGWNGDSVIYSHLGGMSSMLILFSLTVTLNYA